MRIVQISDIHVGSGLFRPDLLEAAIAEIQGNRNPLIDHPEWCQKIDFSGVWP